MELEGSLGSKQFSVNLSIMNLVQTFNEILSYLGKERNLLGSGAGAKSNEQCLLI